MLKSLLAFIALTILAADTSSAAPIHFERVGGRLFVNAADVAAELDYEFKVVTPHRLVTLCRDGVDGLCIPVRLNGDNHHGDGDKLLIDPDTLGKAVRRRLSESNGRIVIDDRPNENSHARSPDVPAYNAAWGQDRGFRVGQTLPDIPLVDLDGNEVRFSKFLGKRYILYAWASW